MDKPGATKKDSSEIDENMPLESLLDLKPDEIKAYCRRHLHDWKCPKDIAFLKELPKNTMGKVLKEEVKKLFLS